MPDEYKVRLITMIQDLVREALPRWTPTAPLERNGPPHTISTEDLILQLTQVFERARTSLATLPRTTPYAAALKDDLRLFVNLKKIKSSVYHLREAVSKTLKQGMGNQGMRDLLMLNAVAKPLAFLSRFPTVSSVPNNATTSWKDTDLIAWCSATEKIFQTIRRKIRAVRHRLPSNSRTTLEQDRKDFYERAYRSRSTPLTHVDLPDGSTVTGPESIPHILTAIYRPFSTKLEAPNPLPDWANTMYSRKAKGIPDDAFQNIMVAASSTEVYEALASTKGGSCGLGPISHEILRMVVTYSGRSPENNPLLCALTLLANTILEQGTLPLSLRDLIMIPIPKPNSPSSSPESLRPISIIPEFSKLISRILARRILNVFTLHPEFLHRSQRGFIRTGSTSQAINVIIDILEDAQHRPDQTATDDVFVASYDLSKAYDAIQAFTIELSLRRFNFPQAFISFFLSTLEEASASVLTPFGLSKPFRLLSSVKQGCPLAPLIFIICMDALLCGIDTNPLKADTRDGYVMETKEDFNTPTIAVTAYADDFTTTSRRLKGLENMHEWVVCFLDFHGMKVNVNKSFYSGRQAPSHPAPPPPGPSKNRFFAIQAPPLRLSSSRSHG